MVHTLFAFIERRNIDWDVWELVRYEGTSRDVENIVFSGCKLKAENHIIDDIDTLLTEYSITIPRSDQLYHRVGFPWFAHDDAKYVLTIRQLSEFRGIPDDVSANIKRIIEYYSDEQSTTYFALNDVSSELFVGIECDLFEELIEDLKRRRGEYRLILMF